MHVLRSLILASGLISFVCVAGESIVPPLQAADIKVLDQTYEGLSAITVTGEMVLADGEAFSEAASTVGHAVVVFSSPGGSLFAGLQIGQLIQLHHFATVVLHGDYCASACAFAWLSGAPRMMEDGGQVGFHAAYEEQGGAKVESGVGNALVGAYLNNLGMSAETIIYIEMAQPDQITWLTQADAQRLGLAVKFFSPTDGGATGNGGQTDPGSPPVTTDPEAPSSSRRAESILLPDLIKPLPQTAVPSASVEDQARSFINIYFAQWSEANDQALPYFDATYGESVIFYGRQIDHQSLMSSKQHYAEQWPNRIYNLHPNTLKIFCNDGNMVCTVSGVVDWDCKSLRNVTSEGSANFRLTVAFDKPTPDILAESGSVISRDIR